MIPRMNLVSRRPFLHRWRRIQLQPRPWSFERCPGNVQPGTATRQTFPAYAQTNLRAGGRIARRNTVMTNTAATTEYVEVTTGSGRLKGRREAVVTVFKGIPYAE